MTPATSASGRGRPLDEVFDDLWELGLRLTTHEHPPGSGWMPVARLPSDVEAAHARVVAEVGDGRRAAADLVPWACVVVAAPAALPALLGFGTASWSGDPDIHVRRGDGGWIDAVSVRPTRVTATSADIEPTVAEVVTTVGPLVTALTDALPMTPTTSWAALLDGLTGLALYLAASGVADPDATWGRLLAFGDALATLTPIRNRPRPFPIAWPGGRRLFHVRVTCCLAYRSADDRARGGDAYCNTCPLRSDDSRERRLRASLIEPS